MFCTQKLVSFSSPLAADCYNLARTVWSQSVLFVSKHLAVYHLSISSQKSPSFHNFYEQAGKVQPSQDKSTWLSHRGILVLGSHRISAGLQGYNYIYPLCLPCPHTSSSSHSTGGAQGAWQGSHTPSLDSSKEHPPTLTHFPLLGKCLFQYPVRLQASVRMVQTARKVCLKFKPLAKQ